MKLKRKGVRALAMVGAVAAVLMVGGSAQATGSLIDWDRVRDIIGQIKEYEHVHTRYCGHDTDRPDPGPSVPEPSAALVFGVGLLVARGFARRKR